MNLSTDRFFFDVANHIFSAEASSIDFPVCMPQWPKSIKLTNPKTKGSMEFNQSEVNTSNGDFQYAMYQNLDSSEVDGCWERIYYVQIFND